jgi:hypothetical protein
VRAWQGDQMFLWEVAQNVVRSIFVKIKSLF